MLGVQLPLQLPLGIIMLRTRFPRPVGDVGNAESFAFEVHYEVAEAATVDTVVTSPSDDTTAAASGAMLDSIILAGRRLVARGCRSLTTSCGFLVRHQQRLHDLFLQEFGVPVVTSSLLQTSFAWRQVSGAYSGSGPEDAARLGVVTFDAEKLCFEDLMLGTLTEKEQEEARARVVIAGLPLGELRGAIKEDRTELCLERAAAEVLQAARSLGPISGLVLECTNLPPYRDALRKEIGVPVYDLPGLLHGLMGH